MTNVRVQARALDGSGRLVRETTVSVFGNSVPGVRTFFALVWSLFMVGTVATILVSAASVFEGLLGWSFWFSVGLTSVLVGIFTTSGGVKAVAVTDAVSCVVLIAGAALLCGIGLWHVGGPAAMIARVSYHAANVVQSVSAVSPTGRTKSRA